MSGGDPTPARDASSHFAGMRLIGAEGTRAALTYSAAADALHEALASGLDPDHDAPRSRVVTGAGQVLLMPSTWSDSSGVKVLTTTEGNAARGLPVIQGVFVLFDGAAQQPVALVDGAALTGLRTPAVSLLAHRLLRHDERPGHLVLFGSGVQAVAHLAALLEAGAVASVDLVARHPDRLAPLTELAGRHGVPAQVRTHASADEVVAGADLVCCCTASPAPLFTGAVLPDHAVVVAMGSHTPDARELDSDLVTRSTVLVESRSSALQEAGDLIIPRDEGRLAQDDLVTMRDLVTATVHLPSTGPRVFKGTGMPWQDLIVGAALWRATG